MPLRGEERKRKTASFLAGDPPTQQIRNRNSRQSLLYQCLRRCLPHFGLLFGVIVYILVGAGIFHAVEGPHELRTRSNAIRLYDEHLETLARTLHTTCYQEDHPLPTWRVEFRSRLIRFLENWDQSNRLSPAPMIPADLYDRKAGNHTAAVDKLIKWDYASALAFSFSIATTIGSGHHFPSTQLGRSICIIYALIGIPLTLITVANLGKFLAAFLLILLHNLRRLWSKINCRAARPSVPRHIITEEGEPVENLGRPLVENNKVSCMIVFTLFIGFTLMGAVLFAYWGDDHSGRRALSFFDSFFMVFATLFTISFGDFLPPPESSSALQPVYLIALGLYTLVGLVIASLLLSLAAVLVRKVHYSGERPSNPKLLRECPLWFGPDQLTTEEFVRSIAAYCNLSPTSADALIEDLGVVVYNAMAKKHGRSGLPGGLHGIAGRGGRITISHKKHIRQSLMLDEQRFGILFSIANDSIPFMDDGVVSLVSSVYPTGQANV